MEILSYLFFFVSIVCVVAFFGILARPSDQIQYRGGLPIDRQKELKNVLIGTFVFAFLGWLILPNETAEKKIVFSNEPAQLTEVTAAPILAAPASNEVNYSLGHLPFKRSLLLSKLKGLDRSFKMEKGFLDDSIERYLGSDKHNNLVELIGTEDSLQSVTWVLIPSQNSFKNGMSMIELYAYTKIICGKAGANWVTQSIKSMTADVESEYSDSTIINHKVIKASFTPVMHSITVHIKQE